MLCTLNSTASTVVENDLPRIIESIGEGTYGRVLSTTVGPVQSLRSDEARLDCPILVNDFKLALKDFKNFLRTRSLVRSIVNEVTNKTWNREVMTFFTLGDVANLVTVFDVFVFNSPLYPRPQYPNVDPSTQNQAYIFSGPRLVLNHYNISLLKLITDRSMYFTSVTDLADNTFDPPVTEGSIREQERQYRTIRSRLPVSLPLTVEHVKNILFTILTGLTTMHDRTIIHRDLKPENVLLSKGSVNADVVLCDLGFARFESEGGVADIANGSPTASGNSSGTNASAHTEGQNNQMTVYVATRWYRAPELLTHSRYKTPVDIWVIGCILYEMVTTRPLFPAHNDQEQLLMVLRHIYLDLRDKDFAHLPRETSQEQATLDRAVKDLMRSIVNTVMSRNPLTAQQRGVNSPDFIREAINTSGPVDFSSPDSVSESLRFSIFKDATYLCAMQLTYLRSRVSPDGTPRPPKDFYSYPADLEAYRFPHPPPNNVTGDGSDALPSEEITRLSRLVSSVREEPITEANNVVVTLNTANVPMSDHIDVSNAPLALNIPLVDISMTAQDTPSVEYLNVHSRAFHVALKALWSSKAQEDLTNAIDFMRQCLIFNPTTRPRAETLLYHPFLHAFSPLPTYQQPPKEESVDSVPPTPSSLVQAASFSSTNVGSQSNQIPPPSPSTTTLSLSRSSLAILQAPFEGRFNALRPFAPIVLSFTKARVFAQFVKMEILQCQSVVLSSQRRIPGYVLAEAMGVFQLAHDRALREDRFSSDRHKNLLDLDSHFQARYRVFYLRSRELLEEFDEINRQLAHLSSGHGHGHGHGHGLGEYNDLLEGRQNVIMTLHRLTEQKNELIALYHSSEKHIMEGYRSQLQASLTSTLASASASASVLPSSSSSLLPPASATSSSSSSSSSLSVPAPAPASQVTMDTPTSSRTEHFSLEILRRTAHDSIKRHVLRLEDSAKQLKEYETTLRELCNYLGVSENDIHIPLPPTTSASTITNANANIATSTAVSMTTNNPTPEGRPRIRTIHGTPYEEFVQFINLRRSIVAAKVQINLDATLLSRERVRQRHAFALSSMHATRDAIELRLFDAFSLNAAAIVACCGLVYEEEEILSQMVDLHLDILQLLTYQFYGFVQQVYKMFYQDWNHIAFRAIMENLHALIYYDYMRVPLNYLTGFTNAEVTTYRVVPQGISFILEPVVLDESSSLIERLSQKARLTAQLAETLELGSLRTPWVGSFAEISPLQAHERAIAMRFLNLCLSRVPSHCPSSLNNMPVAGTSTQSSGMGRSSGNSHEPVITQMRTHHRFVSLRNEVLTTAAEFACLPNGFFRRQATFDLVLLNSLLELVSSDQQEIPLLHHSAVTSRRQVMDILRQYRYSGDLISEQTCRRRDRVPSSFRDRIFSRHPEPHLRFRDLFDPAIEGLALEFRHLNSILFSMNTIYAPTVLPVGKLRALSSRRIRNAAQTQEVNPLAWGIFNAFTSTDLFDHNTWMKQEVAQVIQSAAQNPLIPGAFAVTTPKVSSFFGSEASVPSSVLSSPSSTSSTSSTSSWVDGVEEHPMVMNSFLPVRYFLAGAALRCMEMHTMSAQRAEVPTIGYNLHTHPLPLLRSFTPQRITLELLAQQRKELLVYDSSFAMFHHHHYNGDGLEIASMFFDALAQREPIRVPSDPQATLRVFLSTFYTSAPIFLSSERAGVANGGKNSGISNTSKNGNPNGNPPTILNSYRAVQCYSDFFISKDVNRQAYETQLRGFSSPSHLEDVVMDSMRQMTLHVPSTCFNSGVPALHTSPRMACYHFGLFDHSQQDGHRRRRLQHSQLQVKAVSIKPPSPRNPPQNFIYYHFMLQAEAVLLSERQASTSGTNSTSHAASSSVSNGNTNHAFKAEDIQLLMTPFVNLVSQHPTKNVLRYEATNDVNWESTMKYFRNQNLLSRLHQYTSGYLSLRALFNDNSVYYMFKSQLEMNKARNRRVATYTYFFYGFWHRFMTQEHPNPPAGSPEHQQIRSHLAMLAQAQAHAQAHQTSAPVQQQAQLLEQQQMQEMAREHARAFFRAHQTQAQDRSRARHAQTQVQAQAHAQTQTQTQAHVQVHAQTQTHAHAQASYVAFNSLQQQ